MLEIMKILNQEFKKAYKKIKLLEHNGLTNVFQHILEYKYFYDILFSEKFPTKYTSLFIKHYMLFPKKIISSYAKNDIDFDLYYTFCASATIGLIIHWRNTGYTQSVLHMSTQTIKFFSRDFN